MECTWKDCKGIATHPQLDKNGKEWSNLCNKHHNELDKSIEGLFPKSILKSWVLSSGGAEKLANSVMEGIK